MVKNLVFDLGNVLVEFKPIDYMLRIGFEPEMATELNKLIFANPMWNEFDRGTITIESYSKQLKKENPQFSAEIDRVFGSDWVSNMFILDSDVSEFLEEMSHKYRIFILSNVSQYVLEHIKTLGFWKHVSGGTYSYLIRACKPEKEIYEAFFRENHVNPAECLFLDDKPENIEAAKKWGMKGIIFKKNLEEVLEMIKKLS